MYLLLQTLVLLSASTHGPQLPAAIQKCVAQKQGVTVVWTQRPTYMAVFFTKSQTPDYVIAIREQESKRNRALVCTHDGKSIILGASTDEHPFSDMKNDEYMSSRWRVCNKKAVMKLKQYYEGVPEPINQSVCLLWEDGEGLIYSNGQEFRWKSLAP